ncbi:MAG: threonine--tRNA ligase [Candidatus Woesearchaeota archaeon]|jgi:threonyl-tRNA synthetase|nr:threonine--tRNA ligase [Candidatus Woesearchaeota archaeon]MDP7505971.1 threonine--tRNA ligase [Candidatus Woesearchaeota archaeon]MDP7610320.1 threonine--tRNA ligase [Candidatus Woesearchaeota archaeon]|tara:strand:+ start:733 stop:2649 length:1917 start_codon:yes stop_codon:yes gene_type:complete
MAKIKITFPDGSKKEYDKGITALDIVKKDISEGLARKALAAKLDDELIDLTRPIEKSGKLKIFTFDDEEGVMVFRHSSAHVLAMAVKKLFPKVKLTIGPVVEEGFYYDFDKKEPFHPEDLERIEKEMHEIVKENVSFERVELSKEEAKKAFKDNSYKLELVEEFETGLSGYKNGEFIDLCKGPHVPSTGVLKAFKLTKIAGAYWRGDSDNKQLQRVYGISFPKRSMLDDYLELLEQAEKRNHRKIGREMDLFSFHEEAPGMPFWHNKGLILWNELMKYWKLEHDIDGYQEVRTPIILNRKLWESSGHWDHYKDNMYFTKIDNQDFAVKPMNCPGGVLIYKEKTHSYRELPLKMAEVGLVHRHELSGVLNGLFRVRAFFQDDAHIYCTKEQIKKEVITIINLTKRIYKTFNLEYHMELSTKPEKSIGTKEMWDTAENALKDALKDIKADYKLNEGDGAFYGPKIDFHIKDALNRTWQTATIQLDFAMPERFDLNYEGKDGKKHRPAMLHRTVYGGIERFIGILIEHFAGRFPLWLSPIQARILTVADRFDGYAKTVKEELEDSGMRVEIDSRSESIPYKVRDAQMERIPLVITVGEREEGSKTLAVRTLDGKLFPNIRIMKLVETVRENVEKKDVRIEL